MVLKLGGVPYYAALLSSWLVECLCCYHGCHSLEASVLHIPQWRGLGTCCRNLCKCCSVLAGALSVVGLFEAGGGFHLWRTAACPDAVLPCSHGLLFCSCSMHCHMQCGQLVLTACTYALCVQHWCSFQRRCLASFKEPSWPGPEVSDGGSLCALDDCPLLPGAVLFVWLGEDWVLREPCALSWNLLGCLASPKRV